MKLSSLVGHVVELLGSFQGSSLPADALIAAFFRERRYLGSKDRRFIAETFYGILRNRRLCDHLLSEAGDVLTDVTDEGRSLLRVAAYFVVLLPSSPVRVADLMEMMDEGPHADRFREGLKVLKARGQEGLDRLPPAVRWSFPDWMTERFSALYGPDAVSKVLATLNTPAPLSIRVNTLKTSPEECVRRLQADGVSPTPGKLAPAALTLQKRVNVFTLPAFKEGWFEVQDEGSQFLVAIADPKPTDRVLDMCAGAGGKTLALSANMRNRGEILATDVSSYRLKELRKRMRRAGAGNIRVREDFLASGHDESFDLVFVDAPCSGVGTIRRNPGMKWTVTEDMVTELAEKQTGILDKAAGYVRPGGTLLYATCSMFREENEDVVGRFLSAHPEFTTGEFPPMGESGGPKSGMMRLEPHEHQTDGFFCAKLVRRS